MDEAAAMGLRLIASIALAAMLACVFGRLALRFDRKGAGVIGGVCAGLALGPLGFGQVAPDAFASFMVGGVGLEQRAGQLESGIEGEVEAMRASGVSGIALEEHTAARQAEADQLRTEAEAQRNRRVILAAASAWAAGLLALLHWSLRPPPRRTSRSIPEGVLSGLLTVLIIALGIRLALNIALEAAILAGAVIAAGTIRPIGPRALGVGLGVAAVSVASIAGLGSVAVLWTAVIVGIGWLIGATGLADGLQRSDWSHRIVDLVLVPAVPALLLPLAIGPLPGSFALLVLAVVVLAGDAHLLASVLATKTLCLGARARKPASAWLVVFGRSVPAMSLVLLACVVLTGAIDPRTTEGASILLLVVAHAFGAELGRPSMTRSLAMLRRESSRPLTPP